MKNKLSYYELDVWIKSSELCNVIYNISKSFPKEENFGITSQIRRCSISIASNIAEGCGRDFSKETIRFLYISRGSLFELETQLFIAYDQNYITKETLEKSLELILECKKLLGGFINYYKNKP